MHHVTLARALLPFGLLTIAALLGCAQSEVLVGSASKALDLSVCAGTECSSDVTSVPLESPPSTVCDPGPARSVAIAWEERLAEGREFDELGPCVLEEPRLAVASDGSVWVSAWARSTNDLRLGGVWLAHYGADGERRREAILAADMAPDGFSLSYDLNLTVDARGHIHLAVLRLFISDDGSDPEVAASWLAELDEAGADANERRPIGGRHSQLSLASAGPDAFALGAQEHERSGLALIASDGAMRWTQTNLAGTELWALTADEQGDVTVVTHRPPLGKVAERSGIQRFGSDGVLQWDRELMTPLLMERLTTGDDGSVTRVGVAGGAAPGPGPGMWLGLERVSANGESEWLTYLSAGPLGLGMFEAVATGHDGAVYLPAGTPPAFDQIAFHRVAPDGASCATFAAAVPDGSQLSALAFGPEGELFFVRSSGFGRFAPMEDAL